MNGRAIGYYVHHHGAGHAQRARAIAAGSRGRITLLGTGIGADGVDLDDDRPDSGSFDGIDSAEDRPNALHYAPFDHSGVRSRVAAITRWIVAEQPALMVVDVSVEVAMLARLASVPVVYVRLNGDRSDQAHLECFRGASHLLAPFHEALELATTPVWVRQKTTYFPGITSFVPVVQAKAARAILMVIGRGGPAGDGEAMAAAARSTPDRRWRVIGPCSRPEDCPNNLEILGWVQDPDREIAEAALVVGAAGDGLVTSILAADRPFICLPEPRPFGEQHATAERLELTGAALVVREWPSAQMWPALVRAALELEPKARQRLHDPRGVRSVTDWIVEMASPARRAVQEQAA